MGKLKLYREKKRITEKKQKPRKDHLFYGE
jgi:hypothetical protein